MKPNKFLIALSVILIIAGVVIFIFIQTKLLPEKTESFPDRTTALETTPPGDVVAAAEKGLKPLLNTIPPQEVSNFGFSNQEELEQATLGKSYKVYTITTDNILTYNPKTPLPTILKPTSSWLFSIVSGGSFRSMLTVDCINGSCRAVGIGRRVASAELEEAEKKWSRSNGYNLAFLEIYQPPSDFIIINKGNVYKLFPLIPARTFFNLTSKPYEPFEIIQILAKSITENQ